MQMDASDVQERDQDLTRSQSRVGKEEKEILSEHKHSTYVDKYECVTSDPSSSTPDESPKLTSLTHAHPPSLSQHHKTPASQSGLSKVCVHVKGSAYVDVLRG